MVDAEPPQSSIILYQTEDGRTRVRCRFDLEMLWLTQMLIAGLFQNYRERAPERYLRRGCNLHPRQPFGNSE